MTFPAQTRTDVQALAACDLPVLAAASGEGDEAPRIYGNPAAMAALTGGADVAPWTELDNATLARFGQDLAWFKPPYKATPTTFEVALAEVALAGRSRPLRWRMVSWGLTSADDATNLIAVASDVGSSAPVPAVDPVLLEAVEAAAAAGCIFSEPARGTLAASPGARRLWNITAQEPVIGDMLAVVHPDDVADVLASDRVTGEARREFRILGPNGETVYIARLSRPATAAGMGARRILHVDREVTAARIIERELIQTRSEAEVGARSKSEFLSLMSHELRTPLNAVMGFSQVMSAEMFGPLAPRYLDYAREIGRSAEHVLTIINDILALTRIEAARVQISKEWLDFGRLAAETTRMMMETARQKRVEIHIDAEQAVRIWGEKRALRQLTLNLISNAVKFTGPGGSVTVSVRPSDNGGAVLDVKDTGIGIPEEDLPRIFQPFVQASNAMGRAEAGTGLGLAIVRALVDLHDGDISVTSRLETGTTVSVTIPPAFDPCACDQPVEPQAA